MKVFKICASLSLMIYGIDLLRKALIGQTDFPVEPKHTAMIVISLVCYGVGCWYWITNK
jgi:hypothetical protein